MSEYARILCSHRSLENDSDEINRNVALGKVWESRILEVLANGMKVSPTGGLLHDWYIMNILEHCNSYLTCGVCAVGNSVYTTDCPYVHNVLLRNGFINTTNNNSSYHMYIVNWMKWCMWNGTITSSTYNNTSNVNVSMLNTTVTNTTNVSDGNITITNNTHTIQWKRVKQRKIHVSD